MKRLALAVIATVSLCAALLILRGGFEDTWAKKLATLDVVSAEHDIDLLRKQRFDELRSLMSPGILAANADSQLITMSNLFPKQEPMSVDVVGHHALQQDGFYKSDVTLQYQFSNQWILTTISTNKSKGSTWITGFQAQSMSNSVQHMHRFTFVGKGIDQYLVFLLALVSFAVIIYTVVLSLRPRIARRNMQADAAEPQQLL